MNLLITRHGTVIFDGPIESRDETFGVLTSVLPLSIVEEGDSFVAKSEGITINPTYTKEWDPKEIPWDMLKSGYLSRAFTNYKFYKTEKL